MDKSLSFPLVIRTREGKKKKKKKEKRRKDFLFSFFCSDVPTSVKRHTLILLGLFLPLRPRITLR